MIDTAFWQGKRVFLTGHTGFKGGWAALWLNRLGAWVTGFALLPDSEHSFFETARIGELVDHQVGDVRDQGALVSALCDSSPDIVLHMAAQPLVRRSYAQPIETYATNIMGTAHLLEAARRCSSVRAIIVVTSDKCYANDDNGRPFCEGDPMGGHDPYSSSKGAAELVTASYASSFFSQGRVASVRAGNVIGGGDWSEDRLIPDIVRGLMAGHSVALRHPEAVRPWQHVLEPLSGYLLLAQRMAQSDAFGGAWNFGPAPAEATSVGNLARRACEEWGSPDALTLRKDAPKNREAGILLLDSTKARAQLGWRPCLSFDETVARTMTWYRAFSDGLDMRAYSLMQLDAYKLP